MLDVRCDFPEGVMFRSLKKAASAIERTFETAFSTPPTSHTAFSNTVLTIGSKTVRLGNIIAEGGFSFIHIATSEPSSRSTERYAVKRLSCSDVDTRRQAERESAFLQTLPPHPNIVRFHGSVFQSGHAFLLFDLIDGGTLPDRLARLSTSAPTSDHHLQIFCDVVSAVAHLHSLSPPVAWRDVKLENVLYDRLVHCYKLCDFGSVTTNTVRPKTRAEILAADEDVSENCTLMYRSPELADLYSGHFICEKVDVWALGCIWHAILFGNLPFDGSSSLEISSGLRIIPNTPAYPPAYLQILKACFIVDPADRPDCFAVLTAVRRLQNRLPLESHISQAAQRVRKIRNVDFGRQPASVDIVLTIELAKVENVAETCNRNDDGKYGDNGGDWTDFESAYSQKKPCATDTNDNLIDFSDVVTSTSKQSCSSHGVATKSASAGNNNNDDLIDFFK